MLTIHLISYYIGISIIFLTHIYMIVKMPTMMTHSIINLIAAIMIAYYFMHREGFIQF